MITPEKQNNENNKSNNQLIEKLPKSTDEKSDQQNYENIEKELKELHYALVVGSNTISQKEIMKRLSSQGIVVYEASSAEEAKKLSEKLLPDLIVLNSFIPDRNSIEFCAELRENDHLDWTVIVALSENTAPSKIIEAGNSGVDELLPQAIDPMMLALTTKAKLRRRKKLKQAAINDPSVGCYSKRYLYERIKEEIERAERSRESFSLAICRLKQPDLNFGTIEYQFTLRQFSQFLIQKLRLYDIVACYSNDQLAILMPNTKAIVAKQVFDRLRANWMVNNSNGSQIITFSTGIAEFSQDASTKLELLTAASRTLIAAGENKILTASEVSAGLKSPTQILVVDDSNIIRHLLESRLTEKGYKVYLAKDGEEALRLAIIVRPELMIIDVIMPNMNGLELTRRIRANPTLASTKIIALTSDSQERSVYEAFEAGVNNYIIKPFSFPELERRIKRLLKKRN